jgi:hypothetical protein
LVELAETAVPPAPTTTVTVLGRSLAKNHLETIAPPPPPDPPHPLLPVPIPLRPAPPLPPPPTQTTCTILTPLGFVHVFVPTVVNVCTSCAAFILLLIGILEYSYISLY